jgi:hypothetical protein
MGLKISIPLEWRQILIKKRVSLLDKVKAHPHQMRPVDLNRIAFELETIDTLLVFDRINWLRLMAAIFTQNRMKNEVKGDGN